MSELARIEQRCSAISWNVRPSEEIFLFGHQVPDPALGFCSSLDSQKLELHAIRYQNDLDAANPMHSVHLLSIAASEKIKAVKWIDLRSTHAGMVFVSNEANNSVALYDPMTILGGYQTTLNKAQSSLTAPPPNGFSSAPGYGLVGCLTSEVAGNPTLSVFQPDASNILAGGYDTGVVAFWDIATRQRVHATIDTALDAARCMEWHPSTKDVLAVGCREGIAVLSPKNKKPLMSIQDTGKRINVSGILWMETGKTLALVYNDPTKNSGVVQLWDLRHINFPYKEIGSCHQNPILGIQRVPADNHFFTTASTDGKCVTWVASGSTVCPYSECSLGSNITSFSVTQGKGLAAVSMSADSYTSIHSLEHRLFPDCKLAPSWTMASNAVDFGFGGRIAWYSSPTPSSEAVGGISQLACDEVFVEQVRQFLPYYANDDTGTYCRLKAKEAGECNDELESQIWTLLACNTLPLAERGPHLLDVLGYQVDRVAAETETYLGHAGGSLLMSSSIDEPASNPKHHADVASANAPKSGMGEGDVSPWEQNDAAHFFDKLAQEKQEEGDDSEIADLPTKTPSKEVANHDSLPVGEGYFVATGAEEWRKPPLSLLKNAFLTGNPLAAIELAMKANDYTLAFMLAAGLQDPPILAAVKKGYLETNINPFVATMAMTSDHKFDKIVEECNCEQWREIAALLITYPFTAEVNSRGTCTEFTALCTKLAQKLQNQGDVMSSIACFLVAGAHKEASDAIGSLPASGGSQALKLLILQGMSDPNSEVEPASAQIMGRFVSRLVNAGFLDQAKSMLNYLRTIPGIKQLQFLIQESTESHATPLFPVHEVLTTPSLAQTYAQNQFSKQVGPGNPQLATPPTHTPYYHDKPPFAHDRQVFMHPPPIKANAPIMPGPPPMMMPPMGQPPGRGPGLPPHAGPMSSMGPPPNAMGVPQPMPPPQTRPVPPPVQQQSRRIGMAVNLPPPPPEIAAPPRLAPSTQSSTGPMTMAPRPVPPTAEPNNMSRQSGGYMSSPPPLAGGTTHPAAGVGQLQPGLPTPWPLPTMAQQAASRPPAEKQMTEPLPSTGAPCPVKHLTKIRGTLEAVIASHARAGEDTKKIQEYKEGLQEMCAQLEKGQIDAEVQMKLVELCDLLGAQNQHGAFAVCQSIVGMAWNKNTRRWLGKLKLMAQPPQISNIPTSSNATTSWVNGNAHAPPMRPEFVQGNAPPPPPPWY